MSDLPTPKPTNFDAEAHALRHQLHAKGVVLIVIEAEGRGTGLAAHVTPEWFASVPKALREIAAKVERDIALKQALGEGDRSNGPSLN